jgi:hypothetical protein
MTHGVLAPKGLAWAAAVRTVSRLLGSLPCRIQDRSRDQREWAEEDKSRFVLGLGTANPPCTLAEHEGTPGPSPALYGLGMSTVHFP